MKCLLIPVIILFAYLEGVSQIIDASICTEGEYPFINEYVTIHKSDSFLTYEALRSDVDKLKFEAIGSEPVIYSGYDEYYYLYRFTVYNPSNEPRDLIFMPGSMGFRSADMYKSDHGQWSHIARFGYNYSFGSRPYLFAKYAVPLSVGPSSTSVFYLSIDESHAFKTAGFVLFHPKAMKKFENRFYLIFGVMTGLLTLFFVFNMYLFFTTRDKIHLWYSLYILVQIFLLLKHEGLDAEFLGLDSETGYRLTSLAAVAGLSIAMLMHVVQLYITAIDRNSLIYRLTSYFKYYLFFSAFVQLVIFYIQPNHDLEWTLVQISTKSTFLGLIVTIFYCLYSIRIGARSGWFILAALAVFILGGMQRILFIGTKSAVLAPSLFEIGIVVEMIIISYGLMYRYQLAEKEKKKISEELQKQKLDQIERIIKAQEEERKRIAEDLHDDLGSNLAVMKLQVQASDTDKRLDRLLEMLDKTSKHVRQVSHNLMPPEFANNSLKDVMEAFFEQLNHSSQINFQFIQNGSPNGHFSKDEELMIYRIVMELSKNVLKHSQASEASVQFFYMSDQLEIIAEDDGVGMKETDGDGIGLKNIRSRLEFLKGNLSIDSNRSGSTIIINIPVNSNETA